MYLFEALGSFAHIVMMLPSRSTRVWRDCRLLLECISGGYVREREKIAVLRSLNNPKTRASTFQ